MDGHDAAPPAGERSYPCECLPSLWCGLATNRYESPATPITASTIGAAQTWYAGAPGGASEVRGQAMLTVSKASHATASALTSRPARPSRTRPGRDPAPAEARDECGDRDEQEGDVDRRGAEGDQAADSGGVEAEQQGEAGDDGGGRDGADRRPPPIDAAEEPGGRKHAVASDRVDRPCGQRLGGHAACKERREHDGREGLGRPRAERADDRGRDRIDVAPGDDVGGVRVRERDGEGIENDDGCDAEQRDPDRPRDVARRAPRLLGGADAGVEADEHPAADGEGGEHACADGPARERLGAERLREDGDVLRAEDEQERQADPDRRDDLGGDAGL